MIFLDSPEDLTAGSGLIDINYMEDLYHCFMDEALEDLGGSRGKVVLHLRPIVEQDINTQSQPQANQYNPFFGKTAVPKTNTRNTGTKITPRDIEFTGHIAIGPLDKSQDLTGMGDLADNEATITLVIEALPFLSEALSVSIEGRRYSVDSTRPIGFTKRRYVMAKLREIEEQDLAQGENFG